MQKQRLLHNYMVFRKAWHSILRCAGVRQATVAAPSGDIGWMPDSNSHFECLFCKCL